MTGVGKKREKERANSPHRLQLVTPDMSLLASYAAISTSLMRPPFTYVVVGLCLVSRRVHLVWLVVVVVVVRFGLFPALARDRSRTRRLVRRSNFEIRVSSPKEARII